MESKQPIPSVMAKLMGLDDLPPQQPVQKKSRVLSENYLQRVASIGVREKRLECHSFRLSIEEQKEYRDAFPVLETLKKDDHSGMSVEKKEVHSSSWEVKKLQSSKKHHGAPKFNDSKRDNFLKYLQEPGFLFTKKVNDLQDVPGLSQIRHITDLKSLCASDCRDIVTFRKSRRIGEQEFVNSLKKVKNGLETYSCGKLSLDDMNKFSGSQLESNDGSCLPTTRIVVLKPNVGKAENTIRCFSSSTSSRDIFHLGDRKHKEILSAQNGHFNFKVKERKNLANGVGLVRPRFRFSKDITRRMGHGISNNSAEAAGSEIRSNTSDTFAKQSEFVIHSSPIFSDGKNQYYSSDGLYVAGEAKKRICERWKTTKRFQQVELATRRKTLGEILAIPDHELRPVNLDFKADKCGLSNEASPESGDGNFRTPLGISSWDEWKDGYARDLPRSRSLLVNFNAVGSPNQRTRHKSLQNELGNKLEKDSHGQSSEPSKSFGPKNQTLQDTWVMQEGHKNEGGDCDLSEQNSVVRKSSISSVSSMSMVADTLADAETEVLKGSTIYHEGPQLEPKSCILSLKDEDSSSHVLDTSVQHKQDMSNGMCEEESVSSYCSGRDPESLLSLEKAYQPSPDSVLEPLYKMEMSSCSDCFKNVDAFLHGLHMQLDLLKLETSETCSEGSGMMVSSDEDTGEGSVANSEENEYPMSLFRVEDSRNFSYLVDVLTEAGFHGRNLHMGFDTWHSEECLMSSSVFETLEKKYGEQISWKRSERRLLFDRINLGLMEILQPSMGMPVWTKPVARRFSFRLGQELIEEELWILLVRQENEASKDFEKVLGKDDRWLELTDDIQIIGREIENYLIDELVEDVVRVESF